MILVIPSQALHGLVYYMHIRICTIHVVVLLLVFAVPRALASLCALLSPDLWSRLPLVVTLYSAFIALLV
ncbi:hypothetical protein PAE0409 [Pyrobaculum aerophilum str. IM2]|uniref:Uncharacterized protein n=1 Tax=Pyrobaculum aerophilum (strain ATCC 51768 / DSM 7523 / JCM 9630 / CIP 104966 / NBRC 100827 / IM2) TaxID=178306 RepID=Q8ZZ71_PYRAE|nr:hypothetical protein PAE0409 [Pyrobaculum aerophilum str. IM2]